MSAGSDLRALLLAAPAVSALVSDRISADRIEQGTGRPFIVFTRTATERIKSLDGTVHGVKVIFALQCWGNTRLSADAVADAAEAALEGAFHTVADRSSDYDPALDLEAELLTVEWWE